MKAALKQFFPVFMLTITPLNGANLKKNATKVLGYFTPKTLGYSKLPQPSKNTLEKDETDEILKTAIEYYNSCIVNDNETHETALKRVERIFSRGKENCLDGKKLLKNFETKLQEKTLLIQK